MQKKDKGLEERKTWLKCLSKYVKPGKIVEFGCGSGFVLEVLSMDFADSIIVGVDKSMQRLEKVVEKRLKNVIPVKGDITQDILPDRTFDTVLFVGSLHEVFSYSGKGKVRDAFRMAHNVLKDKGVLIIQDFLKPSSKLVEIALKNEETRRRFLRFANEFQQRKVKFESTNEGVKLDIANAIEFISKYRSPDEEDWKEEMNETHFYLTEKEFRDIVEQAGFAVKRSLYLPKSENWWVDVKKDIEFNFEKEYKWIQLVLTKK